MSTDIFLFPNALLTPEEELSFGQKAVVPALEELLGPCKGPSSLKIFDNPLLSGYNTIQYEWILLSSRTSLAPFAPFLWRGLGGSKIDKEIWALDPYTLKDNFYHEVESEFDMDEECLLIDLLMPIVRPFGFELQVLNGKFFLGRKKTWNLIVCPWPAQKSKQLVPPTGPDASEWLSLQKDISLALTGSEFNRCRSEKQKQEISGLWISGGGFDKPLTPCSQMRCVLTEDPFLIGLAEDCGISKNFINPIAKRWPDCPEGDRLVVFDDFQKHKDNTENWIAYWKQVLDKIDALKQSPVGLPATQTCFVATDGLRISTIKTEKSIGNSLLSRFRNPKNDPSNAINWLRGN